MRYLSFTGFSKYETCPHAYWHEYINKTPKPAASNRANSVFGSVMGRIFELFYKQRAWEKPNCADYLKSLILPEYASYVNQEKERGGVVNWDDPRIKDTEESMLKDARLAVDKSLKTIEKHGLYDKGELDVRMSIEGYEVSKRMLYDQNAIVRTVQRPDDRMNEYDAKIKQLREKLKN
jgi:hypothetical protein